MKSLNQFIALHNQNTQGLRLGQRFFNLYITKGSWPELFYGPDEITIPLIRQWLEDHQYIEELPQVITPFK